MREPTTTEPIPSALTDEAVRWAVKLRFGHPRPATRAAFEAWLATSPLHALAWERLQTLDGEFDRVPRALALDTLRPTGHTKLGAKIARRRALKLLGLAGGAIGTGWLLRESVPWWRVLDDDTTGIGQQRAVHLADGSVVTLNTDSAIDTDLGVQRHTVYFRHGEIHVVARSDATHGTGQPFRVDTAFGEIQALGTRFVVRLLEDAARVSVLEGAVALRPAASFDTAIARQGETWLVSSAQARRTAPPPFDADGWLDGVIAGKNMRLADLLDELSRYRAGRVACDPAVADLRVSGVYQVRNTDLALRFLAQTQPVRVVYRTRYWVTVLPRA